MRCFFSKKIYPTPGKRKLQRACLEAVLREGQEQENKVKENRVGQSACPRAPSCRLPCSPPLPPLLFPHPIADRFLGHVSQVRRLSPPGPGLSSLGKVHIIPVLLEFLPATGPPSSPPRPPASPPLPPTAPQESLVEDQLHPVVRRRLDEQGRPGSHVTDRGCHQVRAWSCRPLLQLHSQRRSRLSPWGAVLLADRVLPLLLAPRHLQT